jgi:hypothetical protein
VRTIVRIGRISGALIVAKKMADSIAAFLAEVVALEEKYGLSISHEDRGGSFLIEIYREENVDWLEAAWDRTGREYEAGDEDDS